MAGPEPEPSRFVAALSVLGVLPPDEAVALLEQRVTALETHCSGQQQALAELAQQIPRVFLIESEFELAMRQAEARWVRGLLGEIADGTLSGVAQWRDYHATGHVPDDLAQLLAEGGPSTGQD